MSGPDLYTVGRVSIAFALGCPPGRTARLECQPVSEEKEGAGRTLHEVGRRSAFNHELRGLAGREGGGGVDLLGVGEERAGGGGEEGEERGEHEGRRWRVAGVV